MTQPDNPNPAPMPESKPRTRKMVGKRFLQACVLVLILGCSFLLVWSSCSKAFEFRDQMKSYMNLQQIGLAIHDYDELNGELPTNSYASDGTPLLSWRVQILPYLGEDGLYKQFKLDEPWDSQHNGRLLERIPEVYRLPRESRKSGGKTYYRGFSNPGAVFERRPARNFAMPLLGGCMTELKTRVSLSTIADPLSETILVVEAAEHVEWTKPDDLDATPGKPFPVLATHGKPARAKAVFANWSAESFKATLPQTLIRALITHSGGEKLPSDWNE